MLRKRNAHKNNVARRFADAKAQSAMEYLMTYGWAILIIAVVLGALFELGVFNANNFAPKAPPGSCQVFRPNGPYTTSFINVEGICNGELPQYVLNDLPSGGGVQVPATSGFLLQTFTVSFWVEINNGDSCLVDCDSFWIVLGNSSNPYRFFIDKEGWNGQPQYAYRFAIAPTGPGCCTTIVDGGSLVSGAWYNFVAVVSSSPSSNTLTGYINGKNVGSGSFIGPINTATITNFYIEWDGNHNEMLSNVQFYNTSLTANEIQALYQEGIGGAPINLQHLVAWWPLNGNANDYSGNGNNGQITNVNFVSNWWSGYTPP